MPISEAEFQSRLDRLHRRMAEAGLEAFIAYASRIHYGAVRYLTGYEPWQTPEEWAFAVVTPRGHGEIGLISNSPWDFWEDQRVLSTWVRDLIISDDWAVEICARLPPGVRRIGIAGWQAFPTGVLERIRAVIGDVDFVDATELSRQLRTIKSSSEIAILESVGRIADEGGRAFIAATHPGSSERSVASMVDAALMVHGSGQLGYPTTLGSGPRTYASCVAPTNRIIKEGDLVQLDCSPMVEGYKADFSRATVAGHGSPEAIRLLETVADAYEACAELLRPGVRCSAIAQAGMDVVTRRGYTEEHLYRSANVRAQGFMAHGIGLENPDPPGIIGLSNDTVLEEGMTINLEPILLVHGLGGVRIEGAFVVAPQPIALSTCDLRPWRASAR